MSGCWPDVGAGRTFPNYQRAGNLRPGAWPDVGAGRTVIASEFGLDLSPGGWPEVGVSRTAWQLPGFWVVRENPISLADKVLPRFGVPPAHDWGMPCNCGQIP